jgi:integrase
MGARRQTGSLRKRKSGGITVWLGLWYENGHRRAKTLGPISTMTKTEAQNALAVIVQRINKQHHVKEYTLRNFTEQVVYPWYERKWKASTKQTTEDRINRHILSALGDKQLSLFTRDKLQDVLDTMAERGLSPSTIAHVRWDIHQIFRMAVNEELLNRNPAELLHIPRGKKRDRPVLTAQQLQLAITALSLRERLIVKLAGICGMRPGEIIALQDGDINDNTLNVQRRYYRGKIDTPKTNNSIRTIALPRSVADDLNAWREQRHANDPEDWLFPSENDKPLWANTLWYDFIKPALQKIGLGFVNYQVLRRTAVTLLNSTANADATIIAAMLGHTVDVSLNTYNKVGIERQRTAVQTLDNELQVTNTVM